MKITIDIDEREIGIALSILRGAMVEVEKKTTFHQCSSTWRAAFNLRRELINALPNPQQQIIKDFYGRPHVTI